MMSPMECLSLFAFYRIFNYFHSIVQKTDSHTDIIAKLQCNYDLFVLL